MAKLSARGRKRIKTSNFAVPKGKGKNPGRNSYPIHDRSHARNALARVSQHGSATEKRMVRSKVARKYPGLGKTKRRR